MYENSSFLNFFEIPVIKFLNFILLHSNTFNLIIVPGKRSPLMVHRLQLLFFSLFCVYFHRLFFSCISFVNKKAYSARRHVFLAWSHKFSFMTIYTSQYKPSIINDYSHSGTFHVSFFTVCTFFEMWCTRLKRPSFSAVYCFVFCSKFFISLVYLLYPHCFALTRVNLWFHHV